jgi:hypothetical protein
VDIQANDPTFAQDRGSLDEHSLNLKKQLIGFLGGDAGTGKSAVIASILTFSKLWGRRDTVETMSSTGLASLNVDGDTIHSSRALNHQSFVHKMNNVIVKKVHCVYLSIIDEVSMLGQRLCGSADAVTRMYANNTLPWGGVHIMLAGDFLQLPPVKCISMYRPPVDGHKTNYSWRTGANALFEGINFTVFLTEIMRQKHDQPFIHVLERMHWGVNTQEDIDLLNTRSMENPAFNLPVHLQQYNGQALEDYFSPMVLATNKDRCAYNRATMYAFANKNNEIIYEVLASSSKAANNTLIYKIRNWDDDRTSKIPFLFSFHTKSMPVMITKRVEQLQSLRCIANGTLGFIVGYIHNNRIYPSPANVHSDDNFRIHTSDTGITVKRFIKAPEFILLKIRDCERILVRGYPPGVAAVPLASYKIEQLQMPGASKPMSMTVSTFPIIPAYALTPEKVQGVTLDYELYMPRLPTRAPQILYVVATRVRALNKLILTDSLTMEYVRTFLPPLHVIKVTMSLIETIKVPSYITQTELDSFHGWLHKQETYSNLAISYHDQRARRR